MPGRAAPSGREEGTALGARFRSLEVAPTRTSPPFPGCKQGVPCCTDPKGRPPRLSSPGAQGCPMPRAARVVSWKGSGDLARTSLLSPDTEGSRAQGGRPAARETRGDARSLERRQCSQGPRAQGGGTGWGPGQRSAPARKTGEGSLATRPARGCAGSSRLDAGERGTSPGGGRGFLAGGPWAPRPLPSRTDQWPRALCGPGVGLWFMAALCKSSRPCGVAAGAAALGLGGLGRTGVPGADLILWSGRAESKSGLRGQQCAQ